MFTGAFAMLHRALRLDARLLHTHLFRLGFASLIYFALLYAQATSLTVGAPGLKLFHTLSYLNLGLITLAGVSFFATAISEEKEEETLSLLRMAGLNPIGILLGKSTSRLVGALLLLLVQFPFTLLAITLGGVTLEQVLACYFSLTGYLILLANVGLLCSVMGRRGSSASAMTVLFLIFYFSAGILISTLKTGLQNGGLAPAGSRTDFALGDLQVACTEASVFTRLNEIMQTGFAESAMGFQFWSNCGVAAFSFGLAWVLFNRFTDPARSKGGSSAQRFARLRAGSRTHGRPRRNSIVWKEFHFTTGGWPAVGGKFVFYGLVVGGILWAADRYWSYTLGEGAQAATLTMLVLFALEASFYISRILHDEWRERTLPLLMMLPIPTAKMVYSKIAGCLPALLPALFWLFVSCGTMPDGPQQFLYTLILPSRWFWGLLVVLFLTLTAFFSLVVRWGALPLAIAVMLTGGSFGGCCFSPVMGMVMMLSGSGGEGSEAGFLCVDIVVALLIAGLQFDIHRRLEIVASQ